ncbi:MAG: LptF/LptG family permease [Bullifex sp.]
MRIVTRYITRSILKTAFITLFVCVMLVLAVELFSSMNSIVSNSVSFAQIMRLSVLGLPEYLMMVVSVAFLFATTFFLSQLSANNELIILFNTGMSYSKIASRIIVLGIIVTLFFFCFSETVMINAKLEHDRLNDELFGLTGTSDSRNITLSDPEESYVVHTSRFSEKRQTIYSVTMIETDGNMIKRRVTADSAEYLEDEGYWRFIRARIWNAENGIIKSSYMDTLDDPLITIEPRLFRNATNDVTTMDRNDAINYLRRLEKLDKSSWYRAATDFWQRLFSPFSILILMVISVSMNYRFKKNVFLFSIILSLCTAVVYYVSIMVFTISSSQGVTEPYMSVLAPILIVSVLSLIVRFIGGARG